MKRIFIISFALVLISCKKTIEKEIPNETTQENSLILEGEKHFKSLKQLTFGGEPIPRVTNHQHLGLTLSNDLRFHPHVNEIIQKVIDDFNNKLICRRN